MKINQIRLKNLALYRPRKLKKSQKKSLNSRGRSSLSFRSRDDGRSRSIDSAGRVGELGPPYAPGRPFGTRPAVAVVSRSRAHHVITGDGGVSQCGACSFFFFERRKGSFLFAPGARKVITPPPRKVRSLEFVFFFFLLRLGQGLEQKSFYWDDYEGISCLT